MIDLSPRLGLISEYIIQHKPMADIGCDHGLLPVYMVLKGLVPKAIAMDLRADPLQKAVTCIKDHCLEEKIDTRLSDGLEALKHFEVETTVIAGMGGILIKDILKKEKNVFIKTKKLILQPMNNAHVLRKYLVCNGYQINTELLAKEDDRIYEIIVVTQGKSELLHPIEYEIGLIEKAADYKLLTEKVSTLIRRDKAILKKLEAHTTETAKQKKVELNKRIEDLLQARKFIENIRNI